MLWRKLNAAANEGSYMTPEGSSPHCAGLSFLSILLYTLPLLLLCFHTSFSNFHWLMILYVYDLSACSAPSVATAVEVLSTELQLATANYLWQCSTSPAQSPHKQQNNPERMNLYAAAGAQPVSPRVATSRLNMTSCEHTHVGPTRSHVCTVTQHVV